MKIRFLDFQRRGIRGYCCLSVQHRFYVIQIGFLRINHIFQRIRFNIKFNVFPPVLDVAIAGNVIPQRRKRQDGPGTQHKNHDQRADTNIQTLFG